MSVDPVTGAIRWAPTIADLGESAVVLRVTDAYLASSTQSFDVRVRSSNLPPSILSVPPTTAFVSGSYRYGVRAEDPEGDAQSFFLDTAPDGMTISETTGLAPPRLWESTRAPNDRPSAALPPSRRT